MRDIKPVTNPRVLPKNGDIGQLNRIYREWKEAVEAYYSNDEAHTDEEIVDIMVACRTLLYMRGCSPQEVDHIIEYVEIKNERRGYYEQA